jgi:exosortase
MASAADQLPSAQTGATASQPVPWLEVGWFSLLLIVANYPILSHLVWQWANDEDVGHGFFVPLVAGYIAWQRRDQIMALDFRPNWWGAAIMSWGVLQGYLGILVAELFLQRTSIVITLVGLLLLIGGTRLIRVLTFPLLLLPFMIPIPGVIYNLLTFPLQLFASSMAESALSLINIPVFRDGNILHLASQDLSVAEACSGIRSLLSLTFLSLVYAYFFDRKVWMRWVLLIGSIPLCILANSARVTLTGILSEINTSLAQGFYHEVEGWIIFIIDLVMLIALHWVINRIYNWKTGGQAVA